VGSTPGTSRFRLRGRGLALAALVLFVSVLAGCTVARPGGAGPLRYRDEVFGSVGVERDLAFGSAPGVSGQPVSLGLDLYTPNGDTSTAPRPAMIWIHGGGFSAGNKTSSDVVQLATTFAKRGYVAASIDYRLLASPGCDGSGALSSNCVLAASAAEHDAQAAVRWLRAHAAQYRIDPNRIAVGGTSAGAVTSVLVATDAGNPGDSGNPGYPSTVGGAVSISGGLPVNSTINAGDAPVLFFHGDADQVVPITWSASNAGALLNAGVLAVWEPLAGAGHVPFEYRDLFFEQSSYFLYDVLDLAHAGSGAVHAPRSIPLGDGRKVTTRGLTR
jgi:dienelactone hydrolase